jgi:hypothetical protein
MAAVVSGGCGDLVEEKLMSEIVKLELPDSIMTHARMLAHRINLPVEEVLSNWLSRFVTDLPVEALTDEELLALCESQMDEEDQQVLDYLLDLQRESEITSAQQEELKALMSTYRQGLIRKSEALIAAVERGLLKPLNE